MAIVKKRLCVLPAWSVAIRLKPNWPVWVGVPLSVPFGASVMPGGRTLFVERLRQVITPPVLVSRICVLYGAPTLPNGNVPEVTFVNGEGTNGATRRVKRCSA